MNKRILMNVEKIEPHLRPAQETIGDDVKRQEDLALMEKRNPREYRCYMELVEKVADKLNECENEGRLSPDRKALLADLNTEEKRFLLMRMGIKVQI